MLGQVRWNKEWLEQANIRRPTGSLLGWHEECRQHLDVANSAHEVPGAKDCDISAMWLVFLQFARAALIAWAW